MPLVLAAGLVQASPGIYKWVDADGNLHFSDCPPPPEEKCEVEEVVVNAGPELSDQELARIAEGRERWMRELDERSQAKLKEEQAQRKERREARKYENEFRQQQCYLARQNLDQLVRAEPVYVYWTERMLESTKKPEGARRQPEDETLRDIQTMIEIIEEYCED